MQELQKSCLAVRGGQPAPLRYKTVPSPSVLFFLTPFCPQTVAARHSLSTPVDPREWFACLSAAAAAAHPTFHKAFVLLGYVYSPKTGFPKRFP